MLAVRHAKVVAQRAVLIVLMVISTSKGHAAHVIEAAIHVQEVVPKTVMVTVLLDFMTKVQHAMVIRLVFNKNI